MGAFVRFFSIVLLGALSPLAHSAAGAGARMPEVRATPFFDGLEALPRPVALGVLPGSERLYLAQASGRVVAIAGRAVAGSGRPAAQTSTLFDLELESRFEEDGLLGIAFHPEFAENRRVFVHYSVPGTRRTRIAELRLARSGVEFKERALIELAQPWRNHNGGQLAFGPDGLLYAGLGDGGSVSDPQSNAQDPKTLLGSIIRIDVEVVSRELPYGLSEVPAFDAGDDAGRPELFAIGLCNPRRFSFDSATGKLWCVDNGHERFSEVNRLEAGDNAGWPLREAFVVLERSAEAGPGEFVEPVASIPHRLGPEPVGGLVLRGEQHAAFDGAYVFGDPVTGRLFAIDADAEGNQRPRPIGFVERPAAFGLGPEGELLIATVSGELLRLVLN